MSELKTNKISPSVGTGITLGDSGDTVTIPVGVTITNNGTQNGFGSTDASDLNAGTLPDARFPAILPAIDGSALTNLPVPAVNTPMFYVSNCSTQTLSSGAITRMTGFLTTATISTGTGYASSRFTCPAGGAGNYIIGGNLSFHSSSGNLSQVYTKFYRNGVWVFGGYNFSLNTSTSGAVHFGHQALTFLTLAVGDTVDIYGAAVGSGTIRQFSTDGGNKNFSNFWGYKLG